MKKLKNLLLITVVCLCLGTIFTACSQKYQLSFETGCEVTVSAVEVEAGKEITLPVPERSGYSFEGWYEKEDFSGIPVKTVKATANATYYAKWVKLFTLTLNADGGSLGCGNTLSVKAGENLQKILKDKIPQKSGLEFGEWFIGKRAVMDQSVMPSSDLTVTAKYKAAYTVEIYERKTELDVFIKTKTENGYAYVGESFTVDGTLEGLEEISTVETVTTITISETSTENVFKRYFEVKKIDLTFASGDGSSSLPEKRVNLRYGDEYEVPSDSFVRKGYWLVGWKSDSDGTIYSTGRIIFNDEKSNVATAKITVRKDDVLTAVWLKGYFNAFGGDDYIFLFDDEPKTAYFVRGGLVFKGDYVVSRKEFYFENSDEDVIIEGNINEDNSFAYKATSLSDASTMLYTVKDGVVKEVKIVFGNNDRLIYTDSNGNSEGYYRIAENNQYHATFTSGDLKGKTMVFILSSYTQENETTGAVEEVKVFRVRNEEEYGKGKVLRATISNGNLVYYPQAYALTFNGFGVVSYLNVRNGGVSTENYYCFIENDTVTLKNSEDVLVGVVRLFTVNGTNCYMFYDEELDGEFSDDEGATLTLDGMYSASFEKGDNLVKGYYGVKTSVFGGRIITLTTGETSYKFVLNKETSSGGVIGGEENSEESVFVLIEKGNDYEEFYFRSDDSVYYAPLLVLGDAGNGTASLYGYTSKATFVSLSSGTYSTDEITGKTTYTAASLDSDSVKDVLSNPFDATKVVSFECFLTEVSSGSFVYRVACWFSYRTANGENKLSSVYSSTVTGEELEVVGNIAYYASPFLSAIGSVLKDGSIMVLTYSDGVVDKKLYFFIDEDSTSFVRLDSQPYTAYYRKKDGTLDEARYLVFDGAGGGKYYENGDEYSGSIANLGEQTFDYDVYSFNSSSDNVSFKFIRVAEALLVYDELYDGTYSSNDGILVLDGFGYCEYTANSEKLYDGPYVVENDSAVSFVVKGVTRYFDLKENSFTLRGEEYGVYTVVDNNYAPYAEFYELDGYSVIKSFTINADGTFVYGASGEYVKKNGRIYSTIVSGAAKTEGEFAIANGTITYTGKRFNVFVTVHKEKVSTYVNTKDWSILILDDVGGAVRIKNDGVTETGGYTLITDNMLYFFTDDGTDACIFRYDHEQGIAVPVKFSNRGYYTTELESLLFSEYGFAIFDGTERCYYDFEGNDVVIYRKDDTSAGGKYGFRKENFGKFENIKIYNEKTYYSNNGYAIKFARDEEGKDEYPVTLVSGSDKKYALGELSFAPNGKKEFRVDATIAINGRRYVAYVRREVDEYNKIRTYLEAGSYTFEIVVDYKGEKEPGSEISEVSSYTVISMKSVVSAAAYRYLDNYYRVYVTNGAKYAANYRNDIGTVYVNTVYDSSGVESASYVSATFGEDSGLYDASGNLLLIERASFTYDSEEGIYVVNFTAADGFDYEFAFGLRYHTAYRRTFGYYVYYLVRTETLTSSEGYEVTAERVIGSDVKGRTAGSFFRVTLSKDGVEIPYYGAIISGDKTEFRYITREKDENGKTTSSTYYVIRFSNSPGGEIGENDKILPTYSSVFVDREDVIVASTEDNETSIDIDSDGNVILLTIGNAVCLVSSSSFDASSGVYTIIAGGKTYTFKLSSDKKTITDFSETAE